MTTSRQPPTADAAASFTGVIWVTGYSGSGKTTVARKLDARLRERGITTVLLDGDDLRAIFAGTFGYSREERIRLAQIYFRLCSHLVAQGHAVILSAVAMYSEVSAWARDNIDGMQQVYLRVPGNERRRRDALTKQVYASLSDETTLYDEPVTPDLVIDNHGAMTADIAADTILRHALACGRARHADRGRARHWSDYYRHQDAPAAPSGFARAVLPRLRPGSRLLEIGCGNGRDAHWFAASGIETTAIDTCADAIALCRQRYVGLPLRFVQASTAEIAAMDASAYDTVYSRFCLHAMTASEEADCLHACAAALRPGGTLYIECRSINDPLARLGEVISPTERIHGHYRRFIVLDQLLAALTAAGLRTVDAIEAGGLAPHGDDDPVVIRVTAERPR